MEQKNERVNGNQKTNQPVLILFSAQPQIQAFVEHGLPWLGRKAVEMGRYGASEALRNKKLQRKAVNCGGGQGGENLPLPVPRSPASRTFLFLCLPTPALYCIFPVIM